MGSEWGEEELIKMVPWERMCMLVTMPPGGPFMSSQTTLVFFERRSLAWSFWKAA